MNQEIRKLLVAALESSVFINPIDPGLTYPELLEVGKRAGYFDGEVSDASFNVGSPRTWSKGKLLPDASQWVFMLPEDPDFRNVAAFDFLMSQLNERVRRDGARIASVTRSVLVEQALASGLPRNDIEAAVTYHVLAGILIEKDGTLRFAHNSGVREPLPSAQLRKMELKPHYDETRARAHAIVKDIIERRTDRRHSAAEALDAFADALAGLGYAHFRLWWVQVVAELRKTEPTATPVAAAVLAAALVEGALTFVVKHARGQNLAVFRSSDFIGDPKRWKIDDLISSAASGSDAAILDPQTRSRAEILVRTRQRIHAGRMLSDFPNGVPDLRPEEARDAQTTAELVVRRVLDWFQKYPPT